MKSKYLVAKHKRPHTYKTMKLQRLEDITMWHNSVTGEYLLNFKKPDEIWNWKNVGQYPTWRNT